MDKEKFELIGGKIAKIILEYNLTVSEVKEIFQRFFLADLEYQFNRLTVTELMEAKPWRNKN